MSGGDAAERRAERRAEAGRWLAIADQDIAAAWLCLGAALPAVAAYHCQQAAEKIAKALLVAAAAPFPKTHDLAAINALASPAYPALAPLLAALEPITVWGLAYRYPPEEESAAAPLPAEIELRLGEIDALRRAATAAIRAAT